MSVLARAGMYVTRKWKKTTILFLLLTTMSTLVMSGLAIIDAKDQQATQVRGSTGGSFTVLVPVEQQQKYLTKDNVKRIADTEGVKAYNAAMPYGIDVLEKTKPNSTGMPMLDSMMFGYGCFNSEYHQLFQSHEYQLVEGRHVKEQGHEAIIAKRFAQKNNLHVGDKFQFHLQTAAYNNPNYHEAADKQELTVVGIYDVDDKRARKFDRENQTDMSSFIDKEDWIFTSMDVADQMVAADPGVYGLDQATFFVDDAAELGSVIEAVKSIPGIDWTYYTIHTNDQTYRDVAGSVASMSSLVSTLVVVTTVVSGVVLALVLTMWMRSRRSEIGVFLALGIGKPTIIAQCVAESLMVAALGFPAGFALARGLAGWLGSLFGKTAADIHVSWGHLISVAWVGSALLIAAVLASCWSVMRFKPKTILAQMS
ncbi:MAG: FtsX-like permease family protein [Propionibacteriaceae bacterium]|jgi:putative ABC transport system permease protein|nr:FtsX-like permease family protein [Propionibacteriaceae bacterium]